MLDRIGAEDYLSCQINKNAVDKKWPSSISISCYASHKLDLNTSSGVLNGSNAVGNLENFIIYCLIEAIDSKKLNEFFTRKEIEIFSKRQVKKEEFKKLFPSLKVMHDQWISVVDFNDLIQLMEAGKIWYNESVQRPLKRIVRGKDYVYKIDISKRQIKNIKEAVLNDTYIPNMIMLEIPEEQSFFYDEEKSILNNENVDHYYIIDGFHRMRGFQDAYNVNKNIQLKIPVMFTYFGTEKANQCIWQEEQKYPMLKSKIDAYNQYSIGVNVANRLNVISIMKGRIGKQNSIIDFFTLSSGINMIFKLNNKDKREEIKLSKEIKEAMDIIVESNLELLDHPWNSKFIISFLCSVKLNNVDIAFINKLCESDIKISNSFNEAQVKKMLKKGEDYV